MQSRAALLTVLVPALAWAAPERAPVLVGLDLEFGHRTSTSAVAIREGALIAAEEINAAGGVLGGRPLRIVERDNRSVPARGVEDLRELAAMPDLVAVVGGKFSPVFLEQLPVAAELGVPLLDAWAAADAIVDAPATRRWSFRLSLRDDWAIAALLEHLGHDGVRHVGLLLPNSDWGRGCEHDAIARARAGGPVAVAVATRWYNFGDRSFGEHYAALRAAGADAVLIVMNEGEGAAFVKEVAALPRPERLPIASHWGILGGDFPALSGPALHEVDLVVADTFEFAGARGATAARVAAAARRLFGEGDLARVSSGAGLAQAYDLVHLLARAVERAGGTDRRRVRAALEQVSGYRGLVRDYARAFTPERHEALAPSDVHLARFDARGALVRVRAR
ncbi:MAG: ABC transporter substrate-binding protein [Anaeromyxobacteraceae bacterium]